MTDRIKALINAYGAACARAARAPRLSPAQDEALRLERVAHDALLSELEGTNMARLTTVEQIADIAHAGGSQGLTESGALTSIRKLTLPYWKQKS